MSIKSKLLRFLVVLALMQPFMSKGQNISVTEHNGVATIDWVGGCSGFYQWELIDGPTCSWTTETTVTFCLDEGAHTFKLKSLPGIDWYNTTPLICLDGDWVTKTFTIDSNIEHDSHGVSNPSTSPIIYHESSGEKYTPQPCDKINYTFSIQPDICAVLIEWGDGMTEIDLVIKYREVGSSTWLDTYIGSCTECYLEGLEDGAYYEFQFAKDCGIDGISDFTSSYQGETVM